MEQSIDKIKETFIKDKIDLVVGGELITFLKFSDNMALLANSENDLDNALVEMVRCFQNNRLKINWNKIKVI